MAYQLLDLNLNTEVFLILMDITHTKHACLLDFDIINGPINIRCSEIVRRKRVHLHFEASFLWGRIP